MNNIYKLASFFVVEFFESDKITPINAKNHIILYGYATLGRIVAKQLKDNEEEFVIISDDLRHVLLTQKSGYKAYLGHLNKAPVLESLKADEASSIIVTVHNLSTKRLICESLFSFKEDINIILNVDTVEEKKSLRDLPIKSFVLAQHEVADLLVQKASEE